ncbi:MAG: gliding motility-associated C-terminal domain-containing protein [Bacteroidetes bacterium]|nr:gliding motility-associated C-terminal domain-containing protein [Bacteroidota bacterium]
MGTPKVVSIGLWICLAFFTWWNPLPILAQLVVTGNDTINPGVPVTLSMQYGTPGIGIDLSDDGIAGPLPIGFDFTYFGNIYDEFFIGANGFISFSPNANAKGTRDAFPIPNNADFNPKNCILGPFQDYNPEQFGSPFIFYVTLGEPPARRLVVYWCQMPMYQCLTTFVTFQIVLHESTNVIENHLIMKPACDEWLGNRATQGLQNANGFTGFAVPGRNATSWNAERESWRYLPVSNDSFRIITIPFHPEDVVGGDKIMFTWYAEGEPIGNQPEIMVAPDFTGDYVAEVELCGSLVYQDTVRILVIPFIPNAFTPNGDGLNDYFRILGLPPENITRFNLEIYNRWGESVFQTHQIDQAWDGQHNGKACPAGVYAWVIYYEDGKKAKVTNRGTITLIR